MLSSCKWLAPARPNPEASLRLFCFPYAGGSSFVFREWADQLPESIEVCPVQLPGRGRRLTEEPFVRFPALLESLAKSIWPWLDKPFVLFGHSLGSTIAFELAHRLNEQFQIEPLHLFVAGRHAPHLPDENPPMHHLPDDQFKEELRRLNGTSPEVLEHPELFQFVMPLLRADFELCETYEYTEREPLNCPITSFGGMADAFVSREQLTAWREHTTSAFSLRMLPGDHFFIHSAESMLLQMLSLELRNVLHGVMVSQA